VRFQVEPVPLGLDAVDVAVKPDHGARHVGKNVAARTGLRPSTALRRAGSSQIP
jgi:hypothetical protein